MARIDLPESRLRARKRRRRLRIGGVVVGAVLVVFGALVALSYAPFLRITTVAIVGASTVASTSVQTLAQSELKGRYLFVFAKDNIFLYPQRTIAQHLQAQYPQFKSVDVHAQDFHTIEVVVAERQTAAQWCASLGSAPSACYYMDESGVVFAPAFVSTSTPYVSYSGGTAGTLPWQYLKPGQFTSLAALVGALTQYEPTDPVRQVVVDQSGDVRAYFKDDFLLMFALSDASGDTFERFRLALTAQPFAGHTLGDFEYLDLRFGDKLYYKLKSASD